MKKSLILIVLIINLAACSGRQVQEDEKAIPTKSPAAAGTATGTGPPERNAIRG